MLIFVNTSFLYVLLSVPRGKPKPKDFEWIFYSKALITWSTTSVTCFEGHQIQDILE